MFAIDQEATVEANLPLSSRKKSVKPHGVCQELDPIIVVGAGPIGVHLVNQLLAKGLRQKIILFGGEPYQPYDRVKLSNVLAGTISPDRLSLDLPQNPYLERHYHCFITSIDPEHKTVSDERGNTYRFSSLVLATGSSPHIPDIRGVDCQRVYTFRDLRDAEALIARSTTSRRTVVVGGGLLGLEAAKAMQRWSTQVTVVQQAPRLMNRQLDSKAAEILLKKVLSLGVDVYLNSGVGQITGRASSDAAGRKTVVGVKLRNGVFIDCDTVIFAAGITPNIDLAVKARLAIGKGITVDEHLRTSDKNIYAIGECAEYNQQVYGLVAPGIEQASILADNIGSHNLEAVYQGSVNASALKVVGETVFSIGEIDTELDRRLQSHTYYDANKSQYRRVFLKKRQLVGALAIGEWSEQSQIRRAVLTKQKILPWSIWSFSRSGGLFGDSPKNDVKQWPAADIICSCKAVTKGCIDKAVAEGCDSVDRVMNTTGAGTLCGSCQPLMAQLVDGTNSVSVKRDVNFTLLGLGSVIAVTLAVCFILLNPIPYVSTVQLDFAFDQLWRDGLYKQITGFSLLAASLLGLLLSLRKRFQRLSFMSFNHWRLVHVSLGIVCLIALVLHTGFRLGDNLNLWLMLNFISLIVIGAFAGIVIGWDKLLGVKLYQKLRSWFTWGHIISFWPFPVLLGFHILSVYYF